MNSNEKFLGIVQNGRFNPLPSRISLITGLRLTRIQMQQASSPESGEIDLREYEGRSLMITYHGNGGEWLYSVQIIDQAGPILTEVVQKVFSSEAKKESL